MKFFNPYTRCTIAGDCTFKSDLRYSGLHLVDDKNLCLLVLLDLTTAFDTIDHEILLNRLKKSFLVSGTVLTWFESYLTNRFYCVKVKNETSQNLPLKYGVPQGLVLGPVLFYADGTQLYGASDTENIHQLIHTTARCIQDISSWMNINKLKLNEDKTDIIIFGCSKSIDSLPVIKFDLNGHEVLCSKKVKNLGAILHGTRIPNWHVKSLHTITVITIC